MTVDITNPSGTTTTLGPYTSDLTDGTVAYFTPDAVGNYTIVFKYGGQMMGNSTSWNEVWADPSQSLPTTLVVQQDAVVERSLPFTPLPTQWWQIPVSAQNCQNWYQLTGAWLGYSANDFATTGSYNVSGRYNPWTEAVTAGHVLWTKPWLAGGVAGGEFGGGETASHYWSTFQYTPRYAPVCIDGIIYSTHYTFGMSSGANQGIDAIDLYTGKTLWTINTTNTLRCGMQMFEYTINDYGVRGPWIWTTGTLPACDTGGSIPSNNTGTQWNLYDGWNGQYVMSVVNGSALTIGQDDNGNMIGYFSNSTSGTQIIHPRAGQNVVATCSGTHITAVNMTVAIGASGAMSPTNLNRNTFRAMNTGYMWDRETPKNLSGVTFNPALSMSSITGDCVVLTSGNNMWGSLGFVTIASMNAMTGDFMAAANITYPGTQAVLPFTRIMFSYGDGLVTMANDVNYDVIAYNVATCTKAWEYQMTGTNGAAPNIYDLFQMKGYFGKGVAIWEGLGGDVWAINDKDGTLKWYGNTTQWAGASGLETPYNVWPVWVFSSSCVSNDVGYFAGGHEYNPPLFHGAQMYAVNMTDGTLVWKELQTSVTSSIIAYGKLVTLNAYDNQLYCFGKGPSGVTVNAPSVGVTTSTPITISGTVMDVSPGTQQQQTASNFPYGLPCVSDESESLFMEAVYQQQPMYNNMTGVPVTISVIDSNNNLREIGTTTSDVSGTFALTWTPDISGDYTVIANFKGSNSYYPSSGEAHFFAGETLTHEPVITPVTGLATTNDLMTYLAGGVIAIIIAIAVVGLFIVRIVKKGP